MNNAYAAEIGLFVLETVRTTGVIATAPFVWNIGPMRVRIALILFLAATAHSYGTPLTELNRPEVVAVYVPYELLVGISIGLVARISLMSVQIAAEKIGMLVGLNTATLIDPTADSPEPAVANLLRQFAMMVAISLGVHRIILASVLASYRVLPPGQLMDATSVLEVLVRFASTSVFAGLRMALPFSAVILTVQAALAFLAKSAPSMQIFSIGFGITIGITLFLLTVALPDLARVLVGVFDAVGPQIERVIAAFGEKR